MIQRTGEGNYSTSADASVGGLQTDNPANGGRLANRASCIRTNGGGSSRRAAGNVLRIPGIVNCAEITHDRTAAVSELVQIMLPKKDCARSFQVAHNLGVFGGNAILE